MASRGEAGRVWVGALLRDGGGVPLPKVRVFVVAILEYRPAVRRVESADHAVLRALLKNALELDCGGEDWVRDVVEN